jgi:Holliday junction resolvasome RuvABC DNA-binding subunit
MQVGGSDPPAAGDDDPAGRPGVDTDAVSALTNLGYSQQIASRAVGHVVESRPDAGLEIILKEALASLVR